MTTYNYNPDPLNGKSILYIILFITLIVLAKLLL